jgi:hypothetical protein
MDRVLPQIVSLVAHHFITPQSADNRPGRWQRYLTRWSQATRGQLPQGALDLVALLVPFGPPASVLDKPAYSAFAGSGLAAILLQRTSARSSSRALKPMSACYPRFSALSITASASLSPKTAFAVPPMRGHDARAHRLVRMDPDPLAGFLRFISTGCHHSSSCAKADQLEK